VTPGGDEVVGGTGFHGWNPHEPPVEVADNLDVAADNLVVAAVASAFASAPAIGPRTAVVDAVGGDEGAVQQQVFLAGLESMLDHVSEVESLGGDHVEGLVEVAVGAGQADVVVDGQVSDRGALAHEPQRQYRLGEAAQYS
jgi:hypothetical protein